MAVHAGPAALFNVRRLMFVFGLIMVFFFFLLVNHLNLHRSYPVNFHDIDRKSTKSGPLRPGLMISATPACVSELKPLGDSGRWPRAVFDQKKYILVETLKGRSACRRKKDEEVKKSPSKRFAIKTSPGTEAR